MTELDFADCSPLAKLERDGIAESFHSGVAVLVDPNGHVLESHGSIGKPIYPRSALKPIQALAMLRMGLDLAPAQAVMTMASHYGTKEQTDLVREILKGHNLVVSDLQCPSDLPWDLEARAACSASPLHMNCSGKHAGFLATCKVNSLGTSNYLDPIHPVQMAAQTLLEQLSKERVYKVTQDGCGAPLFAISTRALAVAIGQFRQLAPRLAEAAFAFPHLIGSSTTPDAAFLRAGVFSKLGAEGVFTVATDSGHCVAIKIADGSLRAAGMIALELLRKHGLVTPKQVDQISQAVAIPVLGGGISVGKLDVLV